ncbi:Glycerol-3-phosphate acyltransferase [BD1-7 clade bacterium]|uniref:Glycerol-3-phosphate acyltransferase n=1 Tax=BD1-7 clade bacterium TaxID=2029982 RepID=A0A5S9QUS5_9GAMM|nr:Glycerol-3-phosphate acyltransferase [BD1-7 clade bacterium]
MLFSPVKAIVHLFFVIFIRPFVRVSLVPEPLPVDLTDKNGKALILVVPNKSYLDEKVIRLALSQYQGLQLHTLWLPHAEKRRANERFAQRLKKLHRDYPKAELLPVSLFWGRMPGRQQGFWTSYLSDNWTVGGALRRFLTLFMQIRNVYCYVGANLDSNILEINTLDNDQAEVVAGQLRRTLAGQREAIIGPDLSHQRILADKVLSSEAVQKAIKETAQNNNKPVEHGQKKAQKYLKEMASDYSYPIVRLFDVFLSWLWERLYQGVDIQGIEQIQGIAEDCELVYVPCHRSHIDYLLLSYVIYHKGYMPPHIAAGINLNLPVVGTLLRRGGAFFIRRQFRDDKIYRAVIETYIQIMCQEGISIEYFIEGGRSRTGFLLQPKAGMLAMTLRAAKQASESDQPERPIAFVPVYIGYERLFESHSYIKELYGEKKEKESIKGLISAAKYLKENFGKVYLNIGQPIFPQAVRQSMIESGSADPHTDDDSFKQWVSGLSTGILEQINRHASLSPLHYTAIAMLGSERNALLAQQLQTQIGLLAELAHMPDYCDTLNYDEMSNQNPIEHALSLGLIRRNDRSSADIFYLDQSGEVSATFLRNNALHVFVMPSLIANILVTTGKVSRRRLRDVCLRLYPYVKADLFLPWPIEALDQVIAKVLDILESHELIDAGSLFIQPLGQETEAFDHLLVLAGAAKAHFQRFHITSQIILDAPSATYSLKSLEERCVQAAQQLSILHEVHAPDFFDKNLFRAFISNLISESIVELDDAGNIAHSDALTQANDKAKYVLGADVRRSIARVSKPAADTEKPE